MAGLLWCLGLAVATGNAFAALEIAFGIDGIEGPDWQAQGISIVVATAGPDVASLDLRLASLDLPDELGRLGELHFHCDRLLRDDASWTCPEGRLRLGESPLAAQDTGWTGRFVDSGDWQIEIARLTLGAGSFALSVTSTAHRWSTQLRAHRLSVPRLAGLVPSLPLPRDWGVKGHVSGLVRAGGAAGAVSELYADLLLDRINYASPDGSQAAENLVVKTELKARAGRGLWYFDAALEWPQGALYTEPLFVDAKSRPLSAGAKGSWTQSAGQLVFDSWSLALPDTVNISGTGRITVPDLGVRDLTVVARSDDAGRLYDSLLQPFLIGSPADDLQVAGRIGLVVHLDERGIEQAGLDLAGLQFEDRQQRYALGRTGGNVAWDRDKAVPVSRLTIDEASVYRIHTGSFAIEARFAGDRVNLVEPVVVPLLGGELALDSFELRGALVAGDAPRWEAGASIRDVSLDQLTAALGWTPFGGTVAGQLKDMRYADRVFSIGGGLHLKAFDGDVTVSGLTIQEPLGSVPILQADAAFRGISLKALTQTFSFGLIEGRLDGDIDELQLVGWQPARFNLHFQTPERDDLRHRISQRAVENLTELGSGVPAGLSTTFLSLFEQFSYDRIDLQIRLQGDVAELDGLARDGGGYYLVRGAGLPRIDVIGRNRSVAWKDLVERLRQIQVEGAQIQ